MEKLSSFFLLKQFCNSVISKERFYIAFVMRRLILECSLGRLQQDSLFFPEMQWQNVVFNFYF